MIDDRSLANVGAVVSARGSVVDVRSDGRLPSIYSVLCTGEEGVLTEIDAKATLRKKLDVDFWRYVILGACNPDLAHRALAAEPQIGLLLPCNVVVQEAPEGGVVVSIADPRAMFAMVDNPAVAPVEPGFGTDCPPRPPRASRARRADRAPLLATAHATAHPSRAPRAVFPRFLQLPVKP